MKGAHHQFDWYLNHVFICLAGIKILGVRILK